MRAEEALLNGEFILRATEMIIFSSGSLYKLKCLSSLRVRSYEALQSLAEAGSSSPWFWLDWSLSLWSCW